MANKRFADEFKAEAVLLTKEVGQHEALRRLGVPVAMVKNWSRS